MEFNLATVHDAVTAANPDREALVFRDRRPRDGAGGPPRPAVGGMGTGHPRADLHKELGDLGLL